MIFSFQSLGISHVLHQFNFIGLYLRRIRSSLWYFFHELKITITHPLDFINTFCYWPILYHLSIRDALIVSISLYLSMSFTCIVFYIGIFKGSIFIGFRNEVFPYILFVFFNSLYFLLWMLFLSYLL
jgi:hypothetical protein